MKAIFRTFVGLFGLLVLGSASNGYYWVSPVFKQPYPVAPSPSNSGFYMVDAWGRLTGPHYYLVPPCQPFNGMLPGPTGAAIQQGYLPHTLLMSKEGLAIGNAPMLGQKPSAGTPEGPNQGPPPVGYASGGAPMGGYGQPMPYGQATGYPLASMPNPMPIANMQVPYGYVPQGPYPIQPAYIQPPLPQPYRPVMMPYPPPMMPYAQPMPQANRPVAYLPYYGPPGAYAITRQDPRTGIWQVQNVIPNQGPQPFRPIPGFNPMPPTSGPMLPTTPMGPMAPMMGPNNGFQSYGPMEQFYPLQPLQPIQGPRMDMQPMQLPRMDMQAPPPRPMGGGAFPTHPFTRSPRDFFMWGESMDEERARGNRPVPVP